MMSRQKMLALGLYGLAFLVVVTYFIGCFEPNNLRMKMSILSSSDDSERALNYYRHSQWKTNEELSRESAQKHTHGTLCTIWLITGIILPMSAVGHSMIMLLQKVSHIKKKCVDIITQKRGYESKDVSGQSKSALGSFLNRNVTIKDEIAGGLIFLLLHKAIRFYRQRTKRSK